MPDDDADKVAMIGAVVMPHSLQHEQIAPDLHRHIGERDRQRPRLECFWQRRRETPDRPASRSTAHGRLFGIEPVGDPGGIDPDTALPSPAMAGQRCAPWRMTTTAGSATCW